MTAIKNRKVDIDGRKYSLVSDDDYLDHIADGFEPDMVRLFRTVTNEPKVVLDIGANIGCTAILFSSLAEEVYAFEPSKSTFEFLQKNLDTANIENVKLFNIGLGAEPSETTLTFAPSNRSGGFVSNTTQASAGHNVETITICTVDSVAEEENLQRVDFIKIDVEGFEGHVIRGASNVFSRFKPVVVLELNHWCLNAFQRTSIPDFFDLLAATFPILYAVHENTYLDLHDAGQRYTVMYHHILSMKYLNIVAAFNAEQLGEFTKKYRYGL